MSYAVSNKRNLSILKSLPDRKSKNAFFAGGRATVGSIMQVFDKDLVRSYVGKVRGIIIEWDGEWKHKTPEAALSAAKSYLADCKVEAKG